VIPMKFSHSPPNKGCQVPLGKKQTTSQTQFRSRHPSKCKKGVPRRSPVFGLSCLVDLALSPGIYKPHFKRSKEKKGGGLTFAPTHRSTPRLNMSGRHLPPVVRLRPPSRGLHRLLFFQGRWAEIVPSGKEGGPPLLFITFSSGELGEHTPPFSHGAPEVFLTRTRG